MPSALSAILYLFLEVLFDSSKKEDEFEDLTWNKTCDWLLLARDNFTQFQNDPVIG